MKKLLVLFLCMVLSVSLVACGGGSSSSEAPAPADDGGSSTGTESPSSADEGSGGGAGQKVVYVCSSLGDMSFNDSGKVGMDRLRDELGYDIQIIETGEDVSRFESYIRDICEDPDAGYLIGSSSYHEYIDMVAPEYPDMNFVVFDIGRDTEVVSDNVQYIVFAQNEGSYLVGMVAAAISQNGVIGAVGGVENPVICDFITGYIEGALAYNPDIKVATAWVGNWTDSAAMLELCTTQYNTYGVDVFFPIAGGAGTGAFEAAMNFDGVWTIGVDADQYGVFKSAGNPMADVIYTSMLKEVGNSFYSIFSDMQNGQEYWGQVRTLGIKEDSVGYADNEYFRSMADAELISLLDETTAKIASGEINVKSYFDFANGMSDYNNYVATVAP